MDFNQFSCKWFQLPVYKSDLHVWPVYLFISHLNDRGIIITKKSFLLWKSSKYKNIKNHFFTIKSQLNSLKVHFILRWIEQLIPDNVQFMVWLQCRLFCSLLNISKNVVSLNPIQDVQEWNQLLFWGRDNSFNIFFKNKLISFLIYFF